MQFQEIVLKTDDRENATQALFRRGPLSRAHLEGGWEEVKRSVLYRHSSSANHNTLLAVFGAGQDNTGTHNVGTLPNGERGSRQNFIVGLFWEVH